MTNKVLREKSHCVVYRSNKSRFLKQNKLTINVICLKNTNCKQYIKTKWRLIVWSVEKIKKILTQKWLQQKIID